MRSDIQHFIRYYFGELKTGIASEEYVAIRGFLNTLDDDAFFPAALRDYYGDCLEEFCADPDIKKLKNAEYITQDNRAGFIIKTISRLSLSLPHAMNILTFAAMDETQIKETGIQSIGIDLPSNQFLFRAGPGSEFYTTDLQEMMQHAVALSFLLDTYTCCKSAIDNTARVDDLALDDDYRAALFMTGQAVPADSTTAGANFLACKSYNQRHFHTLNQLVKQGFGTYTQKLAIDYKTIFKGHQIGLN